MRNLSVVYQIPQHKYIASISFDANNKIGSGDSEGKLNIVDLEKGAVSSHYENHYGRVGIVQWFDNLIAAGSKEGVISISDIRVKKKVLVYGSHSK